MISKNIVCFKINIQDDFLIYIFERERERERERDDQFGLICQFTCLVMRT